MWDLLLKNCTCLDPETAVEQNVDIGVTAGIIVSVKDCSSENSGSAVQTIDACGNYLFPGFIDAHTHLFKHGSTFGMDADRLLTAGVTSAIDMGSAGWINYPAYRQCDISGKSLRIKSFLNVSPIGQPGKGISEPLADDVVHLEDIERTLELYPGEITGLKLRLSRNIVKELGIKPLIRTVEFAEKCKLPVCVHTTDPPVTASEIAERLRPGDIYSHMYHGQGLSILDENSNVPAKLFEAQRNGVLFEVGNGKKNFDFNVAETAIKQGFMPNIISSDSTQASFHQDRCMWDLPFVMSKFIALGMSLSQVLKSVSLTPAPLLKVDEHLGQIKEGFTADLVLCTVKKEETVFRDSFGAERKGQRLIEPYMTFLGGKPVFTGELN